MHRVLTLRKLTEKQMNKPRTISIFVTLAIAIMIVLWLMLCHLRWSPGEPWPPEPEPYIELAAEEFIEPEDIPLPPQTPGDADAPALTDALADAASEVAPSSGADLVSKGQEGTPPREVTTPRPSPVKVADKPQPEKPGPAKSKEPEKPKPSAQRTQVKDIFSKAEGKHNSNNRSGDEANAGSPKGKADSAGPADSKGVTSGVRKGTLGGGWQWPGYARIPSSVTGSVVLSFIVDRDGKARKIVVVGGNPPAASNATLKKRCIAEVSNHTFTRPATAGDPDAETPATITFIFK